MKKRFFLLTAMAAVLFSGCQQQDDFRGTQDESFDIKQMIITAGIEQEKSTRTSTVNDGTGVNILWSDDDSLSVLLNGMQMQTLFTIHTIDEDGLTATFVGNQIVVLGGTIDEDIQTAANVAIYPYTKSPITNCTYNAETGEHSFGMQYPDVQQYAAGGSVGNRAFPMVAVSKSYEHYGFGFRPVGSSIIIGLKGAEGTKIKSITLSSSKQKIAGKATVTASNAGTPTIAIDQTEGVNSITLDCGEEGVALNPETFTQFTVTLPPITVEENELTFTICDTEGGSMEYVYEPAFTFVRNTHYTMNKIGTYEATTTTYPIFIGETGYATLAEACAAAVNGDVIVISEGEFTLPYGLNHDNSGKLTIKGAGNEKTNILGTKNANNNNQLPGNYANGMELVFEDLTYTTVNEGYYGGFGHADSVAFNNCKIVGQMYCHSGAPHTFTDCTIDPLTGYLYTYASNCVFTGCNFEASEGKALQVYAEAAGTFKTTITNCTFTAAKQAQTWDGKPVTGIDVNSANGAVMVVEVTGCSQEGFPVGLNSNSALWNVKSTTADITVTVDGKKVWPVENFTFDEETKTYTVLTPTGLSEALSAAGAAGSGNSTIEISGDLNMEGVEWTPIKVDGYHGADIVTVEGNGATITNLSAPLFEGGFAGGSGIVIQNLTIANSTIVVNNTQGGGSFINCADSMDEITLINCHAENVTLITPNDGADESRLGGLIGWTAGYNNENDGPVDSYITVKNCSVKGCNIKCAGSVGGIIGHSGANAATFTTIENCTVTGNTLTSTDDGGWRVGVVVGTANNGQTTITGIIESGNTVAQTGKTAPEGEKRNYFGRFVPATTGSLTIDGAWYVTSAAELTAAIANEELSNVALLPATYAGTFAVNRQVNLVSAENTKAVINGRVNIGSAGSGSAFENIDFTVSDESTVKNVFTGTNYQYPALVMIYAAAATFEGCSFETDITKAVAGINYGAHAEGKVLTVDKCEFNGDFYPIRSRALLSVTDSKFNSTYSANGLSAVWLWGLNAQGGTTTGSVVFKGNTATSPSGVSLAGVVMAATNYLYNYLTFDVQGNTGFTPIYGTSTSCTYSNNTFVEGSETF